ncbi:hypothetical protein [Acerihabitans arboris]|uniref:Uncharacterized protein n=1 Tax=Acerihabitans arboris TaxID=2691583 RepID=A0A845SF98_9GAMM|nr:hypothetical protein [Acerihabitans arboris]NDL61614.1 hypothetical protein [Acerihabitans arboris]
MGFVKNVLKSQTWPVFQNKESLFEADVLSVLYETSKEVLQAIIPPVRQAIIYLTVLIGCRDIMRESIAVILPKLIIKIRDFIISRIRAKPFH